MKTIIVAQHYHPEVTAAVNRLTALASALCRHGHEVVVIAPKPNHPAGVIAEAYRGSFVKVEQCTGAEVHYTWVYTSPRKNVWRRLLYYITFTLAAIVEACRLKGRYDVVFASSPPPLVGVAGWVIAKLKGARLVFDVRDLWPGLAIALGELKNPLAIAAARAVEGFCYRAADAIVAVTAPFQAEIRRRTADRVPVELVPNGALPLFLDAGSQRSSLREQKGWSGRYVVSYIGNIGVCQGLMHLVEAAEILQASAPDVLLFVQGHGVVKPRLAELAKQKQLSNLVMQDTTPVEEAAAAMAASDAIIVPLARVPMAAQFIPSKLFDAMATGRPVLLSVEGEATRILREAKAGLTYTPEDGRALADAVLQLRANVQKADEMGTNGKSYVNQYYLRSQLSDRLVRFMEQTTGVASADGTLAARI